MKITKNMLRKHEACSDQVELFAAEWPNGAEVTADNVLRAITLALDVSWLTHLMTAGARRDYNAAVAGPLHDYYAAIASTKRDYEAEVAGARRHYYAVRADALVAGLLASEKMP